MTRTLLLLGLLCVGCDDGRGFELTFSRRQAIL